jgi:hypothetical protein
MIDIGKKIPLFQTLNANAKILYIFKYFSKSKKLFVANIYSIILHLMPIKNETLKPPIIHPPLHTV